MLNALARLQSDVVAAMAAWRSVGPVNATPEAILGALGGTDGVEFDEMTYNYGQRMLIAKRGRLKVISDGTSATLYERTLDVIEGGA